MGERTKSVSAQNKEAQFGLLPVLGKERLWGFFDYTYVNVSFAIATWAFLIGGTIAIFADLKMAIIATLSGNLVAVLVMAAATTTPSSKYGFDIYTGIRSIFGNRGNLIILAIITVVQVAWVAILAIMFGRAVLNVVQELAGVEVNSTIPVTILGIGSVLICWAIVCRGPRLMQIFNRIIAPILMLVIILMIYILSNSVGMDTIMAASAIEPFDYRWLNFIIAFELNLGAGFSWFPNMGGLSRITKNARASYWPNMIGLVLVATFGTIIGVATALVFNSTDPTEWMIPLAGPIFGIICLLFICFANLAANTVVSYNFCLGLKQISYFMKQSWVKTTGIFFLPVMVLLCIPDAIYNNFYVLLAFACTLYAPLTAMYLIDYYVFRKQNINLRALYNVSTTSSYSFWGGINWVAVVVFGIGMISYTAFLNPLTLIPVNAIFSYTTATGISFVITAIVYYVAVKLFVLPKNVGGYV